MASTGFWPVKSRLKEVIDYAENPDKTIEKKFLDEDLWSALRYVENEKKTDQTMYVSAINCPKQRAYQCMMATKRRYGKLGGNVAYHGYQSFMSDEVTPAEAHKIGMETAKRMWGAEYEIVVTTHLNTDNIHNHFVLNSVSFKTGRKFENHMLTERLHQRQAEKEELETQLAIENNKRICLSEAQILAFLDYVCEMPLDDFNKRRAIINIFVHSIYLYDDHFTLIINASKKPLSIDNIPLEDIEEAFEGENNETDECSSLTSSVPPQQYYTKPYYYIGGFAITVWLV